MLASVHVTIVVFLVLFYIFDQTTGFYWSTMHTLTLAPVLMHSCLDVADPNRVDYKCGNL